MQLAFLSQGLSLINAALAGELVTDATWATYIKNSTDADNFYTGAAIGLAIAFIAWLSRTVDNVPPLGGGVPHDGPRWAIGWWFIPIAFLWKPFMVVRDAWDRLATTSRRSNAVVVVIWWLGFIGATFVGRYVNAASDVADIDTITTLFTVGIAGGILGIASAVCGFLVVREIQARSDERARSLSLAPATAVWPTVNATATIPAVPSAPAAAASSSAFCPHCGAPRAAGMFCASCGASLGLPASSD